MKKGGVGAKTAPRVGLVASVNFELTSALVTPGSANVEGTVDFAMAGNPSPIVNAVQWNAGVTVTVSNYEGLSVALLTRVAAIQNVNDFAEVAWFYDNIGSGTECCDSGTSISEYTTLLAGLSFEISRTTHGITGFPSVLVLDPAGAEVSVCLDYIGESIFVTSNVLLDNHLAILR